MNPVRVFAFLSHRVPPSDGQPGSTGEPEMTMADAASLTSGMPPRWLAAGRAKWAFDESLRGWWQIELWRVAMELSQHEGWGTDGGTIDGEPVMQRLGALVTAMIYEPAKWDGEGRWQARAAALQASKAEYFRVWDERISRVMMSFEEDASEAWSYVMDRQNNHRRIMSQSIA